MKRSEATQSEATKVSMEPIFRLSLYSGGEGMAGGSVLSLYQGNGFLVQDPVNIDRETSFFLVFSKSYVCKLS